MHRTKRLAYLLGRDIRQTVNIRVTALKAQRQAAISDDSEQGEAEYADATSRLMELSHLVNQLARREDAHRVRLQQEFNSNLSPQNRGVIDRSSPERYNVFDSAQLFDGHPRASEEDMNATG